MNRLPVEILENILRQPRISVQDTINFSETCSYFRGIVLNSQCIWKHKYQQKWPKLMAVVNSLPLDYYDETRYIYEFRARTIAMLETMPARFYKKYELSDIDLEEWREVINERNTTVHYLLAHLREIVTNNTSILSIEVVPLNTPGNKTLQYYASKVLRFITQVHLTKEWYTFISLPQKYQVLEVGATLVAQWCLPQVEVIYAEISKKLTTIADMVQNRLRELNPDHGLFKTNEAELARWRAENLDGHMWDQAECLELLEAMKTVIYGDLGFSCNIVITPQHSFINVVLETRSGLPITMAIIYESVGRRLGIRFKLISFGNHLVLRFNGSESEWYYIDNLNSGNLIKSDTNPQGILSFHKESFPIATTHQVVERMANTLEISIRQHPQPNGRVTRLRSVLELLKLVTPHNLSALVSLAKFYMVHNMNTKSLEQFLISQEFDIPGQAQRIINMLRDYSDHHQQDEHVLFNQVEVARRTSNLKYAVGMIMLHCTLNYKCVIYDWDPICLATIEWQTEMNVNNLRYGNEQPFYNVLVEDGSYRYVAQENLVPTTEVGLLHLNEDIGRHFSHFFFNHYVPNAEKEREYPADYRVRHKFYYDMQIDHYCRLYVPLIKKFSC